jgi:dipeptidyl-peptidase 4
MPFDILAAMNRIAYITFSLVFLLGTQSLSAQKALTIQESVAEAYTTFLPQSPIALAWIPGNEGAFSYLLPDSAGYVLMKGYADGRPHELIISQRELKELFDKTGFIGPRDFPSYEWMDSESIFLSYMGQYWRANVIWKTADKSISCLHIAENEDVSPDHKKAAYTIGETLYYSDRERDSVLVMRGGKGIIPGQAVSRFEFGISKGTFWSPQSNRLAYYVKEENEVGTYDIMDYVPIPAVGVSVKYPMSGQGTEKVSIHVYNIVSQNDISLQTDGPADQYLTSVTWSLDGEYLYVGHLDRAQDNFKLNLYEAKSGKLIRTLLEEHSDKYVEPRHDVFPLQGTDGEFLWISEKDGFEHVYRYAKDGTLLNQVTTGNKVMKEILGYNQEDGALWVMGTDSPTETVLYAVDVNGGDMKRVTAEKGNHKVMMHDGMNNFIDMYSSLTVPLDIKIKDSQGHELYQISSAADPFIGRSIGKTEINEIKAEDGTSLFTRMIKPSNFDPRKKYPVMVYLYNGPHVQLIENSWLGGASLWMHTLAEKGYIIFTLDGRGSGDRGREFEQAVHGRLGIQETKDQMEGVKFLKSLPYIDADRMAIHGWSYGGFMTLNMMLRNPGVFKVGIAGGPVVDWRLYEVMYTERYMETPENNKPGYEETRLPSLADQLQGKLMLIHGSSDDIVVMQHTMVMMNAFINADKQVDMFIYPGHKHNVLGPDRVHLITKIIDYIDAGLKP